MEAAGSSETLIKIYPATRRYIPQKRDLRTQSKGILVNVSTDSRFKL
jgi:hypothetical protein